MSRIFKFRAWDGHKMEQDGALLRPDGDAELNAFDDGVEVIWLQFTGLTDKSGREIYEGDILELGVGELRYRYAVEWDDERALFVPKILWRNFRMSDDSYDAEYIMEPTFDVSKSRYSGDGVLYGADRRFTVIGNIYEHAHLLK